VVEVHEEKNVNVGTFDLTAEEDIWWNTVTDKLQGLELTWAKFLDKHRAKFYPSNHSSMTEGERICGAKYER